jgi:hypothetical protein
MRTLIDSGSSHCFLDSLFVPSHKITTTTILLIGLRLFDGTCNSIITQIAELPIKFPTGEEFTLTFYVTSLDSSCPAVLGHNWLRQYNLLIDWSTSQITFRSTVHRGLALSTSPGKVTLLLEPSLKPLNSPVEPTPHIPNQIPEPLCTSGPPSILMINAAVYVCACRLPGSHAFQLSLSKEGTFAKSAALAETPIDLSGIPEDYHEFANVFSKGKVETLPLHRLYDLKIDLEEGGTPPPGHMYSLSLSELEALHIFIDENVRSGFIKPSNSPHGALILFVKKKDGSLHLCVDYHGLNKIIKKDCYPLPLISDLLDTQRKARLYTKIDLCHAYHLVRVADGEE